MFFLLATYILSCVFWCVPMKQLCCWCSWSFFIDFLRRGHDPFSCNRFTEIKSFPSLVLSGYPQSHIDIVVTRCLKIDTGIDMIFFSTTVSSPSRLSVQFKFSQWSYGGKTGKLIRWQMHCGSQSHWNDIFLCHPSAVWSQSLTDTILKFNCHHQTPLLAQHSSLWACNIAFLFEKAT